MTRRKRSTVTRKATVRKKPQADPSAGLAVAHPAPVQKFFAIIENLMTQPLEVSVLDEGGSVTGLRLSPRGKSRPVERHRIGSFTHDLVKQGRVRIVQTNG